MKLSMTMIEKAFSGHIIYAEIGDNAGYFEGYVLAEQEIPHKVCAADFQISVVDCDVRTAHKVDAAISLVWGESYIILGGMTFAGVVNRLTELFEYYRRWERQLTECVLDESTMQQTLDKCAYVFQNPCFIADMRADIIAITRKDSEKVTNDSWSYLMEKMRPRPDAVSAELLTSAGNIEKDWDSDAKIYLRSDYSMIGRYIMLDGKPVGAFCIRESETPLDADHCRLANRFCDYIAKLISHKAEHELAGDVDILTKALNGEELDPQLLERTVHQAIGSSASHWILSIIQNKSRTDSAHTAIVADTIAQASTPAIVFPYRGCIVVINVKEDMPAFCVWWQSTHHADHYTMGCSMPFFDITQLPLRYRQALFALEQCAAKSASIAHCEENALEYLIVQLDESGADLGLCHPALQALTHYDKQRGTELYHTLHQYLIHERSLLKTAKALYIHRNSLLYRIGRIKSLVDCDLEDPDERLYLLLSYAINAQNADKSPASEVAAEAVKASTAERP